MYDDLREQLSALPDHEPFTAVDARARGVTAGALRRGVLARRARASGARRLPPDRPRGHPRAEGRVPAAGRTARLRDHRPHGRLAAGRRARAGAGSTTSRPRGSASSRLQATGCGNGLSASGERMLTEDDVVEIGGLRVTTALRTACDLGRLLHRDQALAALDSLSRLAAYEPHELLMAPRGSRATAVSSSCATWSPRGPLSQSPGRASCGCAGSTAVSRCRVPDRAARSRRAPRSTWTSAAGGAVRRGVRRCRLPRGGPAGARRGPPRVGAVRAGLDDRGRPGTSPPRPTSGHRPDAPRGSAGRH